MNDKKAKEIRRFAKQVAGDRMIALAYAPTSKGAPARVAPNTQRGVVKAVKKSVGKQ